jgi:diacylglycerol kinase (ATP)
LKLLLAINPRAGSADDAALREGIAALRGAGVEVSPRVMFERGDAARILAAEVRSHDRVVAVGGDGTVHEVGEALIALPDPPPLAIVPAGTGNDLAGSLGVPANAVEALQLAASGQVGRIDLGLANERPFFNASSGGLGAETTGATDEAEKHSLGRLAYWVTGVKKFASLSPDEAVFRVDGEEFYRGPFLAYTVGNAFRVGGDFAICPLAKLDDGLLDLCLIGAGASILELLALFRQVKRGEHLSHPEIRYVQGRSLEVIARRPISITLDGEPSEVSEIRYSLKPRKVAVVPGIAL